MLFITLGLSAQLVGHFSFSCALRSFSLFVESGVFRAPKSGARLEIGWTQKIFDFNPAISGPPRRRCLSASVVSFLFSPGFLTTTSILSSPLPNPPNPSKWASLISSPMPVLPVSNLQPAPALDAARSAIMEERSGRLTRCDFSAQQLAPHPLLCHWVCITKSSMM